MHAFIVEKIQSSTVTHGEHGAVVEVESSSDAQGWRVVVDVGQEQLQLQKQGTTRTSDYLTTCCGAALSVNPTL